MTKKRAVLYARVSTEKEEQEQSLEIQEEIIEQFSNDRGFKLIKPHYLEFGKSGTNISKRPKFIAMLKDAGLKPVPSGSSDMFFEDNGLSPIFDIIIVKEASRFSRNQTEALSVLKELKRKGVEVYFIATNTSTTDDDWEFKLGLYFNLSQTESKNLSVRVKLSKRHNAEKGRYAPSIVPYGYKRIYDENGEKKIVIDEDESKVVKDIFKQYTEAGGHTIARLLNERGILTKSGKTWSDDKITRLIQNPVYIGSPVVMKTKKTNLTDTIRVVTAENERITIEKAVEPIISIEDFNKAQNVRLSRTTNSNKRGQHKSKTDVFSEKLYCATCGARYVRHIGEGKKINYMCQTRRKHGLKQCPSKSIAFNLVMQGLDDSRIRFNSMGNYIQLLTIYEGLQKLIDKNTEIKERIMSEIDKIKADERDTFLFMRDLDKFSRPYELANEELELLSMKHIALEEQFSLIKDETVQRFSAKVKQREVSLKEAQNMEQNEQDLKLLQLHNVLIDDEWVKYCYTVQAYDEVIEEYNRTFGEIVEPISYQSEAYYEETFQRGYRKLITRAEEQEMMNEQYQAIEDLVSN
ncbi:recombinase family protein [Sporosarcina sp. resist]|uniref:recombinase family protein n=1 Tax=Sporosarcina sp. resist TaxID=2762563 RepID=UPI00164E690A|nr:recombinase family protein [Sporosarcina sp. resist]QNK86401.1 recombinase family protein [Sporosarcina sp. resist]